MKNLLFLLALLPLVAFLPATEPTDFVGKWEGVDKGEIGFIVFDDEGYATFEIEGQVIGGKSFELNGKKGQMTYVVHADTKPMAVDFVVTKFDTEEQKKILCIAEFKDADHLLFAMAFDAPRPTEFTEENSIMLKRVD